MSRVDPATPAWVLDAAQDAIHRMDEALTQAMLDKGEDVTDDTLWRHRRLQLRSLVRRELEQQ